jgi:hypothetical protein
VVAGHDTIESVTLRAYSEGVDGVTTLLGQYRATGKWPEGMAQSSDGRTYGWYGLSQFLRASRRLSQRARG